MAFVEGFKKFMGMSPLEEDFLEEEEDEISKEEFSDNNSDNNIDEVNNFDEYDEYNTNENKVIFTDNFNTFNNNKKENDSVMENINGLNGLNGLGAFDNNSYHSSMFGNNNEQKNDQQPAIPQVVLVKPERFEDASDIADSMLAKKTIVINTDSLSQDVRRRMVDFLSGVAYADGATIKKASNTTFVMTPDTVGLIGEGLTEDDDSSSRTQNGVDEKYY